MTPRIQMGIPIFRKEGPIESWLHRILVHFFLISSLFLLIRYGILRYKGPKGHQSDFLNDVTEPIFLFPQLRHTEQHQRMKLITNDITKAYPFFVSNSSKTVFAKSLSCLRCIDCCPKLFRRSVRVEKSPLTLPKLKKGK